MPECSWDIQHKQFLSHTCKQCYISVLVQPGRSPGKDHFTVVGWATWLLNGSEAGVDLVLIQTLLLLLYKSSCSHVN